MNKKLLKNKNFMLIVIGDFMSVIGSNIQQFVLSLYVLALTGSATMFASMLAISILPRLLLSPIAGVFGDWFDRKKAIIILDLFNALVLAGFAFYILYVGELSIALIYVLVIILETTEIFFHSAMSAVIPSVVSKEQYLEANSFRTMLLSFASLMAPILGAIIYGSFGLLIAIVINAVSFLLSAISETFISLSHKKDNKETKNFKKDFIAGIKMIQQSNHIKTIMSLVMIINFSIAPLYSVGIIFLIKEVLKQSDLRLGLFQTMLSASMIAAPILLTKKIKQMKLSDVLNKSFLMLGLLIIGISISVHQAIISVSDGFISYIIVLTIGFLIGMLVAVINISISTLIQKVVPVSHMGRISTTIGLISAVMIPVGQVLFGYLYDIINPGIVMILNGGVIIIATMIYYQKIRAIDTNPNKEKSFKKVMEANES